MGLFDYIVKSAKEVGERSQSYKEDMQFKSDSELARIVKYEKDTSPLKASTALRELKNRGYSDDYIQDMIRSA